MWRVVSRGGLAAASVRTVAAEAGLSAGSLRHWFTTQSDLHAFAMSGVVERIRARASALDLPQDPLEAAALALEQFLPLDVERAVESEVWLAFTARSLVDPPLQAVRRQAYDELFDLCRHHVQRLLPGGAASSTVDAETHRLYALLDGLLLHGVLRPERVVPELLRAVLRAHLEQLATPRGTGDLGG